MDDLVAELTLRLRNEMTAGLEEVRGQLQSVEATVTELRAPLSSVDSLMADMTAPTGIGGVFSEITAEVDDTAAAVREMGATLDAEALRARELIAESAALQDELVAPKSEGAAPFTAELAAAEELRTALTQAATSAATTAEATQQIGGAFAEDGRQARALIDEAAQLQSTLGAFEKDTAVFGALARDFEDGAGAAHDMASAVDAIGQAIDGDVHTMQQLLTQMHEAQAQIAEPRALVGGGDTGGLPPGRPPGEEPFVPPPVPPSPDEDAGDRGAHPKGGFDLFGMLSAGLLGMTGFDQFAAYDTAAKQITVTEGLGPEAAEKEASRLKTLMDGMANTFGASSEDLMRTYAFLITDSLTKQTVESMMPSLAEASTAYNVPTSDIAQAAFTLNKNLEISPEDMGDALAVLHHATMKGHFSMEDFSQALPELGGQMSLIGMKGMPADITAASALEMIRRNTGTGGEAATELQDFLMYMHSMMALRMFDRSKRMTEMLGPSGQRILEKYHVEPLDLPHYLDGAEHHGVDPINAMTDYFAKLLAPVKSPIERADLVGAYMHNQSAQDAILALVQYKQDFEQYQTDLTQVSDKTLNRDFETATSGSSGDSRIFHEGMAQTMRDVGGVFDYGIAPLDQVYRWLSPSYSPPDTGNGHGGSGITLTPHIPITVNVHVDKDGNATVSGGLAGAPDVAPGTNVRVNQGSVLAGVH